MSYLNKYTFICMLAVSAAICGCADDYGDDAPVSPRQNVRIGFNMTTTEMQSADNPAADDGVVSRAASMDVDDIESFRIYGALWEGSDPYNSVFSFYQIPGEVVVPAKGGGWTTETPYYWPAKGRLMSFLAYTPIDIEGLQYTNPRESPDNARFYFTSPSDVKKQREMLFSHPTQRINYTDNPTEKVKLEFNRALAHVVLDINGDTQRVASISLKNVWGSGGFHPNTGGGWWDYLNYDMSDDAAKYTITIAIPESGNVSDEDMTLIVIPQVTPWDATLEVQMRDGTSRSIAFQYKTFLKNAITTLHINLP